MGVTPPPKRPVDKERLDKLYDNHAAKQSKLKGVREKNKEEEDAQILERRQVTIKQGGADVGVEAGERLYDNALAKKDRIALLQERQIADELGMLKGYYQEKAMGEDVQGLHDNLADLHDMHAARQDVLKKKREQQEKEEKERFEAKKKTPRGSRQARCFVRPGQGTKRKARGV